MRRTFTLQMHDVPSTLPLLCPTCDQVVVSAKDVAWWNEHGLTPMCGDCKPSGPDVRHYPCGECAIATEPTDDPKCRICPACKDRGHAWKRATGACHPHPTRSVAMARRKPWGPLRTCKRCASRVLGHYDYCESCIDQLRQCANAIGRELFENAMPPLGFNCRSSIGNIDHTGVHHTVATSDAIGRELFEAIKKERP